MKPIPKSTSTVKQYSINTHTQSGQEKNKNTVSKSKLKQKTSESSLQFYCLKNLSNQRISK